ncbi:MAG: hypothetical protein Q8Q60_04050 [Candidatus Chromulinivorax sp.]|nr:hypothetical protein [Candidatus Chromulinivorax sp.]
MDYKKIVFSLVLMSCASFVIGMENDQKSILVTSPEQQAKRRLQLQKIAIEKRQTIEGIKAFGELSPVSVAKADQQSPVQSCMKGSRAYKQNARVSFRLPMKLQHISLALSMFIPVGFHQKMTRLSVRPSSSLEEID